MELNETKTIVTPEQVEIVYSLAGIGTRFGALVADTFLQLLVAGLAVGLLALLGIGIARWRLSPVDAMRVPAWLMAITIVAVFGVMWGYYILWETLWNGQTPGKRLAGIRVMRDGGYPVDFRAAFVRNIVRYVDFLPAFYGVGTLAIFLSKDSKRLGDYAAGTIVVMDGAPTPATAARAPAPVPAAAPQQLLTDPTFLNLRAISRGQFSVLDRFLARRATLPADVRAALARKIALSLMPVIGMTPPADEGYAYESLLVELAQAYRNRRGN
ncbi:MAG TPA: RDD family protein [Armatimonadota bacterium]|nr:RDD family protein [Armatimonadota bacterium]